MKKMIFLIGFALLAMWACNTANNESSQCSCAADKDALEIVMNIPIKVKPEFISAYKIAFEKCRTETLKEDACMAYDLFQSYTDSTEFHLFERWKNKPGHQSHMEMDHLKQFFAEIEGMRDQAATQSVVVTVCPEVN